MLPKTHIVLGLVFSLLVLFFFPEIGILGFFIIWASSVLIDVDHYFIYVYIKEDWSLKRASRWFSDKLAKFKKLSRNQRKAKAKQIVLAPCFLHGIEATIALIALSFVSNLFFYVLLGVLFHYFLDLIHIINMGCGYRHLGLQSYNFIKFRNKNVEKI